MYRQVYKIHDTNYWSPTRAVMQKLIKYSIRTFNLQTNFKCHLHYITGTLDTYCTICTQVNDKAKVIMIFK